LNEHTAEISGPTGYQIKWKISLALFTLEEWSNVDDLDVYRIQQAGLIAAGRLIGDATRAEFKTWFDDSAWLALTIDGTIEIHLHDRDAIETGVVKFARDMRTVCELAGIDGRSLSVSSSQVELASYYEKIELIGYGDSDRYSLMLDSPPSIRRVRNWPLISGIGKRLHPGEHRSGSETIFDLLSRGIRITFMVLIGSYVLWVFIWLLFSLATGNLPCGREANYWIPCG